MNNLLTDSFELERDIEMGNRNSENKSDYGLEEFFQEVREIEMLLDKMSSISHKLQEANEEYKSVTKVSAMKGIKGRMEKDINEVGKITLSIKVKLEKMDRANLENRKMPGCGKGTGVDRSRMSMTIALKNKLKERMKDFENLRDIIQEEYRQVVARMVFTVTGEQPSNEVIDHLIETGSSEQIFQNAIQGIGRGQIIAMVEEIQERHDVVMEIEKRLLELQQIFADLAALVETQGETLNDIENQVYNLHFVAKLYLKLRHVSFISRSNFQIQNAVNYLQDGTDALRTAKSLQKKSRKCMFIAIIILLVIAAIVVFSILKPWAK